MVKFFENIKIYGIKLKWYLEGNVLNVSFKIE